MRNLMKNIPNTITCLNLFSGSLACVMAMERNYIGALIFIIFAAVFDFLDGFAARLLKAYSPLGKELDSLADVVSFGLAPGLILFSFLQEVLASSSIDTGFHFLAFLVPIFAALRLAKFNIDTRQSESFLGLPVPANGLFWCSLIPTIHPYIEGHETLLLISIISLIIFFCLMMVSEVPMFSLKFKNYEWKGNELRYILILLSILSVVLFHSLGISVSICLYILMSIINNVQLDRK